MPVLQLIYSKGSNEILNRQSALGSYIFCLCGLLEKNGWKVFINKDPFDSLVISSDKPGTLKSRKKFSVGKFVPSFIKDVLRDKKLFRRNELVYKDCISLPNSPDLIMEFYTYGSDLSLKVSAYYNKPYCLVFDAPVLEEYEFFNGKKIVGRNKILKLQKASVEHASGIVVYSESMKDFVAGIGAVKEKIRIHQNVDFSRFEFFEPKPFSNEMCIGFIGSFLKWHNVDLLLEAFSDLRKDGFNIRLKLVGAGMEFDRIKSKVMSGPDSNQIELLGYLDGAELASEKRKMHIGVMPGSNWYGAPNKIFEYGAAGLAVVAPDTLTIHDLFGKDKEVLLFKENSKDQLVASLRVLITDSNRYDEQCLKLQHRIKSDYSETNTVQFYSSFFDFILS